MSKDFTGKEIEVGDKLVVAMREGNSARLRIARVTGFGRRGDERWGDDTILVDWLVVDEYYSPDSEWARTGKSGYIFANRAGSVLVVKEGAL